ncbi:MAG: hypothetical protein ACYCZB_06290 [Acidiphilium sp.]
MGHWIVLRRDESGEVHRVHGVWEAETAEDAIRQKLAADGSQDDGYWEAQPADEREDLLQWHLDRDSKGRPKRSPG